MQNDRTERMIDLSDGVAYFAKAALIAGVFGVLLYLFW